ncbi:MAG TPA: uracil-DNA glycosylase family protein, partial [Longimicrobiaceae bacterium]|nr:uracil-DNA glycosylase family protein [Longimicrobiaceae bacterium]
LRQIELIQPRAVLAVGSFAAQTLLETNTSISRLRGTAREYHGVPLVPTYHPAALLRNPAWIRPVWEDLQRLRAILDRT